MSLKRGSCMGKTRYVFQITRSCYRTWKSAPKILVLLGMIACFVVIYARPFAENASVQGEQLQAGEMFVALMNWRFTMLLFSTASLLMFGNLPVIERFTGNALIRGTRRSWIMGQIIYVVLTSLAIALLIFVVSLIVGLPNINFSNEWSRPVKLIALSKRAALSGGTLQIFIPKYIVVTYSPWQAFAHSFCMFFMMNCFYGVAALMLRMKFKSAGFVILMAFNTVAWSSAIFMPGMNEFVIMSILSVHYHTSLSAHQAANMNALLPTLGESYAIMIGATLLMALLAVLVVRKYDYVQSEEENT